MHIFHAKNSCILLFSTPMPHRCLTLQCTMSAVYRGSLTADRVTIPFPAVSLLQHTCPCCDAVQPNQRVCAHRDLFLRCSFWRLEFTNSSCHAREYFLTFALLVSDEGFELTGRQSSFTERDTARVLLHVDARGVASENWQLVFKCSIVSRLVAARRG